MINIQQKPLNIAYVNVHLEQEVLNSLLTGSDRLVAADVFVESDIKCGIVRGQFYGWFQLFFDNIGEIVSDFKSDTTYILKTMNGLSSLMTANNNINK